MARTLLLLACLLSPLAAQADCFEDAAAYHHVNPVILRAISLVESGNRPPTVVNRNSNGSEDYGRMQINSIHLQELASYGVDKRDLFDECKSIYTGAWILRKSIERYGNTWEAIGSYHSSTPYYRDRYAAKVKAMVDRIAASTGFEGEQR